MKKKEILPFETKLIKGHYAKWNQTENVKYFMISLLCEILKKQAHTYIEHRGGYHGQRTGGGQNGLRGSTGTNFQL